MLEPVTSFAWLGLSLTSPVLESGRTSGGESILPPCPRICLVVRREESFSYTQAGKVSNRVDCQRSEHLHPNFARFVLFRLIKKRSSNLSKAGSFAYTLRIGIYLVLRRDGSISYKPSTSKCLV